MTAALAGSVAAVFLLLALVHVYWAFGGRIGKSAAVPQINGRASFAPGRLGTLGVALALLIAALLVAATGGLVASPASARVMRWLCTALGAALIARAIGDFRLIGFFKRERGSAFARLDTAAYSPLCLALGVAVLLVVRGVG